MQIFFNRFPPIRIHRLRSDFEPFYTPLALGGLITGVILLGIGLAYVLVNFSPFLAFLLVLAGPVGLIFITRPQLGLLLLVFAIPLEEFNEFGPGLSMLKLLSIFVFGGAAIHFLIFRRKESLVNAPQNWLILGFVLIVVLSNFITLAPLRTFSGTIKLLRVLTLYLVVINLVKTEKDLRNLIWVFLISGFISALWGLLDPAQANQRIYGTLGQPNLFALTMVPRLPLALCLLNVEKGLLKRLALLTILGVVSYGLILSGSRGGLMAATLALVLFVLTQRNKLLWLSLVGVIVLTGLAAMPLEIRQRVGLVAAPGGDDIGNSTDRRETYQIYGWQLWQENPVLGIGLDSFAEAYARSEFRFLQKNRQERIAHNTYLEVAVGTGLAGFIPFVVLLGLSLFKTWQYAANLNTPPYLANISAGLLAGQGGYFLGMLFASRQYEKTLWLLIALVVAVQVVIHGAEHRRLSFINRDW
jgi:O-antigen ligase